MLRHARPCAGHPPLATRAEPKTWMAGPGPAMTAEGADMVENRPFGNILPHLILWIGILVVAFPVYLAFVGSTHEPTIIANGQMPLTPGALFFENYYRTIFIGTSGTTREPVYTMLLNSFVMAMVIACGKIFISILSAYAIV